MFRLLFALAVALLLAGCSQPEPPRRIVVSCSRLYHPLAADLAREAGIQADLEAALPARAVADVREGLADLAIIGRDLHADESGVVAHPLARDGLALIVHRANPVASLTDSQAMGLFTRLHTDWQDLGGTGRPVVLVGLGEGRAAREAFLDHFDLKGARIRPDLVVGTSDLVVQAVATRPAAIGYVSLAGAREALKAGGVRVVSLGNVAPTHQNIATGKYLFTRPVILISRPSPPEAVRDFLATALADKGRALIVEHGLVPLIP